jgi:chemotaxis protein CheD
MLIIGKKSGSVSRMTESSLHTMTKGYPTHTVIGGEFAISQNPKIALKTLLGSCVAIMFYDRIKKIHAMNHFLLPSTSSSSNDMKYGLYSVESMLNEMYKLGCSKQSMVAKISGGANILSTVTSSNIGQRNVEFAKDFCNTEGFRIMSEHSRGEHSRVILLVENFETFIKTSSKDDSIVSRNESSLQREVSRTPVSTSFEIQDDFIDFSSSRKVTSSYSVEDDFIDFNNSKSSSSAGELELF